MKLIIDVPDNVYAKVMEYCEHNEIVEAVYGYIYHGTPIPDNATVCDIEQIRAEIVECLEAINHIKAMPIQLYTPNEIEARKLTYEQCLGFIDKYTK